jgi:nucleoside permease NupC
MWIVLNFATAGFAVIGAIMGTDRGVDPDMAAALARYGMYAVAALSAALLLTAEARAWFVTAPPPD